MRKSKIVRPTAAEDRAINQGIKADPDTYVLTPAEFAELRPFKRGRPVSAVHKVPVTVRLDPQVIQFFRAGGRGWQTRMNAALAAHVARQQRRG